MAICADDSCEIEVIRTKVGGTRGLCHIHWREWLEAGAPVEERPASTVPPLVERIQEVRAALQRLQAGIRASCPGPHEYVKHGDVRPPWCHACGYTDTGLHKSELRAHEAMDRWSSYSDEFLAAVAEVYLAGRVRRRGQQAVVDQFGDGPVKAWLAAAQQRGFIPRQRDWAR
jgi:hypothetical protein